MLRSRTIAPLGAVVAALLLPAAASAAPPTCEVGPQTFTMPANATSETYAPCWDEDGDPISVELTQAPLHGVLEPTEWGSYLYTTNADSDGEDDVIKFRATANNETSEEGTIVVEIRGLNHAPACDDTSLSVRTGGSIVLPAPDCVDEDGDYWEASSQPSVRPAHGVYDVSTQRYKPAKGFTGADKVTFGVTDGWGRETTWAVNIRVTQVPAPPDPPPPSDKTPPSLDLLGKKAQRLAGSLRRGVAIAVNSNEAGRLVMKATVSRRVARRLGIKRNATGRVTVGAYAADLAAGRTRVRLPLSRRAKARMKKASQVKLAITATMTDAAGNASTKAFAVTLKKPAAK